MSTPYYRTEAQKAHDYAAARQYEEYVAGVLGPHIITRFDSPTELDIWSPGLYVDIKEKAQHYTDRWTGLVPHIPEEHLFILDELSVRRAAKHYPEAFFLIRDQLTRRLYLLPIWEMISVERTRVNRVGKGKWLIDLRHFRQLADESQLKDIAVELLSRTDWLRSEALSQLPIPQV